MFNDFTSKQQIVDKALSDFFPEPGPFGQIVFDAMRYSLFAGGKRFRPVLALMAYEAIKDDFQKALPAACALEYIHTYSLIHDDLPCIDNDDFRRGMPTCHKKYGEAVALLAGDALFAQAFNLIGQKQQAESEVLVEVIRDLAQASGAEGMVGGQVVDILASGKGRIAEEELFYIHSNKTGKLIIAAAKIGARLAMADSKQLEAIEDYAFNLGVAFQIYDDILDEIGDSQVMGKSAGSDRRQQKATYPLTFGLEKAKEMALEHCRKAIIALGDIKSDNLVRLAQFVVGRES